MSKIRKRADQRKEDTWALEDIYSTDRDWQQDVDELERKMEQFVRHQGHMSDGSERMLAVLNDYCEMNQQFGKIYVYANMRFHEDMGNSHYQKLSGQSESLRVKLGSVCSWMQPEILAMDWETIERYLQEEKGLQLYRIFFEELFRQKAHTLSGEQEQMLALAREMGQTPDRVYGMLQNADMTFGMVQGRDGKQIPLTGENFVMLEESTDRQLRRDAFEKFYTSYQKLGNTMAALFDANIRQDLFFARQRRYADTREAHLDEAPSPVQVYDQLIETVHKNLPSMYRYVALRKKLLQVEELHMYDVYVPVVLDADRKYSFEEAKKIVLEGLEPLGEEYLSILREGFDNRWIDVYENEGKRGGAYSWGDYGTHPYVLMNYQGNLNHVFTLAHEMGHSIHSYYTRKNQPYIYGQYFTFVAEVASTCNEVLLLQSLLEKTTDSSERKYLLNHFLEQFKGTLFRQTMFAEFEKITHERAEAGETLTVETLCGIYLELNRKYFGEEMVSDPLIAWEWARIPHFYTPFYVYQYATGLSAAVAIAKKIRNREPQAVENYKKFLSGGCSMPPLELLKLCGVDMTRPEPVQDALDLFAKCLDDMEQEAF